MLPEAPKTAQGDRRYLQMDIPEYQKFANAVASKCYLNRVGDLCQLKNAKTKKLKNIRTVIKRSPFLMQSMIWKEQLRLIEQELLLRRGSPQRRNQL